MAGPHRPSYGPMKTPDVCISVDQTDGGPQTSLVIADTAKGTPVGDELLGHMKEINAARAAAYADVFAGKASSVEIPTVDILKLSLAAQDVIQKAPACPTGTNKDNLIPGSSFRANGKPIILSP